MEVHVTPELAKKLNDLAATTGRAPDELVQDALAGYLEEELASLRVTLDSGYDDLKSGLVESPNQLLPQAVSPDGKQLLFRDLSLNLPQISTCCRSTIARFRVARRSRPQPPRALRRTVRRDHGQKRLDAVR